MKKHLADCFSWVEKYLLMADQLIISNYGDMMKGDVWAGVMEKTLDNCFFPGGTSYIEDFAVNRIEDNQILVLKLL